MTLLPWDRLPNAMRLEEVRPYYEILARRRFRIFLCRVADRVLAAALLLLLSPIFAAVAICIKLDSPQEPVIFRQTRVTQYGRKFSICKFRTMTSNRKEGENPAVTTCNDARVTRPGLFLRRSRLDELPQLWNILKGEMAFVGVRPEVPSYVARYTPEMMATLLLPAGLTSEASIAYQDEARLLVPGCDVDEVYLTQILPAKMGYNLRELRVYGPLHCLKIMFRTLFAVAA
ncbi:sugar transferase [Clostridiaceae bacterium NSJ-31]|uniref:Sugar transferase n=1 Tax=Ligaoa zhengdingensis TaxID=2763658 RepID=A0A926I4R1_9FIRM|nr:sugar transferase [Ligaoa zhengdingensis]MBC8546738.1 sugar transferase [Ligaoa zhengdingensis]